MLVVAAVALTGCGAAAPVTEPPASTTAAPVGGTSGFTDPARWATLPPFPRPMLLLTDHDVAAAFPRDGAWEASATAGTGIGWAESWCDGSGYLVDQPASDVPSPSDEHVLAWFVPDGDGASAGARFEAHRWAPGAAGTASADQWGRALTESVTDCPDGEQLDASGIPGAAPVLTAAPAADGRWDVQAATSGGPTAVRLRATVTADSAEAAAAPVPGLMTTAIARLAAADDAASHTRDHPADRPALTAGHLLTDTDTGRPDRPADPPPVAGPVEDAARADGWCPESPLRGVPLPEQAWSTSWTEPGPFELGFDVMTVDERVLRFSGLGDEGGVAAARAYSAALRAGARACADAAADGRQVHVSDHGVEGDDSLVVAVDQGDGTWRATATARDGVTLLVVSTRVRWEGEWYDDAVIALTSQAWRRVHETDGTVR